MRRARGMRGGKAKVVRVRLGVDERDGGRKDGEDKERGGGKMGQGKVKKVRNGMKEG